MGFDPLAGDPLRAETWDDFIGQEKLKERLDRHIMAAVKEGRAPGHILLVADPGCGKTTLARIIARRMGTDFETFTMPVKLENIVRLLIVREFDGVLLLDEIHRASVKEQEDLLTLIESNYIQYRGERFQVGYLTVVGATTEPKKVIKTLKDRFPFIPDLDPYTNEELCEIVSKMTEKLGVILDEDDIIKLGAACGGTPRHARRFALAARDLLVVNGTIPEAAEILDHLRIDEQGLSVDHWRYLEALNRLGGQAGLKTISSYLNENESVVEELERLLVKQDLVDYTERGRALRTAGFERIRKGHSDTQATGDEEVSPTIES